MRIRETFAAMGRGKRVACGACAVALAAGLGLGGAYAAGAWPGGATGDAQTAATAAAVADDAAESWAVRVGVRADGWDAETSSPVICHVTGAGGEVDFYHAYDANADVAVEVPADGDYEVTFVTPVNADGSIYRVGDAVAAMADAADGADATTAAATTEAASLDDPVATFTRVDAADVAADELTKVVEQVAEAVRKGDETLSGDAGAKVAQAVAANAKANANADASKVEEQASAAESTAKEGKSEAKTATSSTASKKASASTSASAGKATSSGSSGSASSSGSSSGSSSSPTGSGQQASSHQHSWSPVYRTETTYTTVDRYEDVQDYTAIYVCNACGATFDSVDGFYEHSDALWDQGIDHGSYYIGSKPAGTYKAWVGSYQEATGTKQVLDHYECSCGATKAA